jgi:hypothetical protein
MLYNPCPSLIMPFVYRPEKEEYKRTRMKFERMTDSGVGGLGGTSARPSSDYSKALPG